MKTTRHSRPFAFTLVELLVATAVVILVMGMLVSMIASVNTQLSRASARSDAFQSARNAFELLTRKISQATLNTYWDYDDPSNPTRYQRQSELRFISGEASELISSVKPDAVSHCVFFQSPLGSVTNQNLRSLDSLLSTTGFYVERNSDSGFIPPLPGIKARDRYRLMELREPAEEMTLFSYTSGSTTYNGREWFLEPLAKPQNQRMVGENVLALILIPKLAQKDQEDGANAGQELLPTNSYVYDSSEEGQGSVRAFYSSKHQLPPLFQVVMIATDEASAARLESRAGSTPLNYTNLFQNPADLESDLASFEQQLISNNMDYRILSTEVQIAASKWSIQ